MKDFETIDDVALDDVTGGFDLSSLWNRAKDAVKDVIKKLPVPPFTVPLGPLPYPPQAGKDVV